MPPSGEACVWRALFDFFDTDAGDELNFKQGDLVEILETLDDGWCVGRDSAGKVGMLPANFVEETNSPAAQIASDCPPDACKHIVIAERQALADFLQQERAVDELVGALTL